jgi:hypothetical protein
MNDEQKASKVEQVQRILPLIWNSYVHMFEARKNRTQTNLNFLLIIVSFLPAICIMLFSCFKEYLFLVPTIFQFTALLILLKSFYLKVQQIPWLPIEETTKDLDKHEFDIKLFACLKAAEDNTGVHRKELDKIVKLALFFLIASIIFIVLSFLFMFLNGNLQLYVSTALLILLLLTLILYYRKHPNFDFTRKEEEYLKKLIEWIDTK